MRRKTFREATKSLMRIRLEMGRTRDFPEGDQYYSYEFIAPLDRHGHLGMRRHGVSRCGGVAFAAFVPASPSLMARCAMSGGAGGSTICRATPITANRSSGSTGMSSRLTSTSS
jgi:hypothetical protein